MTNAGIAERLLALAQLLAAQKENPYKIKAYRRAAETDRIYIPSVEGGLLAPYRRTETVTQ